MTSRYKNVTWNKNNKSWTFQLTIRRGVRLRKSGYKTDYEAFLALSRAKYRAECMANLEWEIEDPEPYKIYV